MSVSAIGEKIDSIDQLKEGDKYTLYNPTASKKGEWDSGWRWGKFIKIDERGRAVFKEFNRAGETTNEITSTVVKTGHDTYYPVYTGWRPARGGTRTRYKRSKSNRIKRTRAYFRR
jgi:hypothetical protein